MQVLVDNSLVSYTKIGSSKRTILFLHGWADSSKTFAALSSELKSGFSLVIVDLPGFGVSQAPKIAWGIENYANFIKSFLDKINIKDLEAVVGHSNGGTIAIDAVANEIIKPKKLILLASAGIRNKNKSKKSSMKILSKPAKYLIKPLPKNIQLKIKKNVYNKLGSDLYIAENMQETFKNIVSTDIQSEAGKVKIPTLLIYGETDNATPAIYGEILSSIIPDSKLKVLSNSGHFVHHEKPEAVSKLIKNFID